LSHPAPSRAFDSPEEATDESDHEPTIPRDVSRDAETPIRKLPGEITVRIYTYLNGGRWYAEAPKMSLMTEGASEDEAVRCLVEQIVAYVRTVVSHGWFDRLYRPVSPIHRARLWVKVGLAMLRLRTAHRRSRLVRV
jgi:hypothetical protein